MIFILRKEIHFRENWLIFLGILGEAELILGIWGANANNFREKSVTAHILTVYILSINFIIQKCNLCAVTYVVRYQYYIF